MSETRKIAAILVSDVVGYSRLAGADEDRALARLRAVRSDLIDPIIAVHHGRVVKRTGNGAIVEFRSVVDAVRCAIEVQHGMIERFDKPLADLFDMQDEIVARLAGALNTELAAAEARRAERTSNPDSIDLYFQGMAWFNKGLTPDNMAQARSYFDRALAARVIVMISRTTASSSCPSLARPRRPASAQSRR